MGFQFQVPTVVGGTVLVIEQIESQNYVAGVSGWVLEADGDAEVSNLVARGSLIGGQVVINGTAYPNAIAFFTNNAGEVEPATIEPTGSGGATTGILELNSPKLKPGVTPPAQITLGGQADGTGSLEMDVIGPNGHVRMTASDAITIESGGGVRVSGDFTHYVEFDPSGKMTGANLTDPSNSFPSIPYSVAYSGTTDASGFLVVTHGASFTPSGGFAMTTNPAASFAQPWGIDSINATTVRLRFANVAGTGAAASTAVSGRLFLVK